MRPHIVQPLIFCAIALSFGLPAAGQQGVCYNGANVGADAGIAACSALIRSHPSANAYNERGLGYFQKGQFDLAIADLTEAIRLDPKPTFYVSRALNFLGKNDLAKAHADYTEAIRRNPNDAIAYAWRGRAYQLAGQFGDAIGDEDEAIRLNSKLPIAYTFRGLAYEGKGDQERARADFSRASALNPDRDPQLCVRDALCRP